MHIPGVQYFEGEGWLIPTNVLKMGQRPGNVFSYPMDPQETTPSGLKLKDYQRRVVTALRRLEPRDGGAFNAGDMGLGKSVSTLQALWLDGYLQRPGLVCGPLAARSTWCDEGGDPLKHYGLTIRPLEAKMENPPLAQGGWWFVHWDILKTMMPGILLQLKPRCLVADESHLCSNLRGLRAQAALNVSYMGSVERRIMLTGTPIPKDRLDFHGQLAICQPGQWTKSRQTFGVAYENGHMEVPEDNSSPGWMVYDGPSNTEELRARLAGTYLRYTKEQVPGELPKLTRHRIEIKMSPEGKQEYEVARRDALKYLKKKKEGQEIPKQISVGSQQQPTMIKNKRIPIELITTSVLKMVLSAEKQRQARFIVNDLCQKHKRLVVFTWKIDVAKNLFKAMQQDFKGVLDLDGHGAPPKLFGPIDGSHSKARRDAECKAFVQERWSILIATRGSVGVSINHLAAADACLQVTPDWNPAGNLQAESRLHREGATAAEIHSYYMLAPGTIDDHILSLLDKKSEEAASLEEEDRGGMHLCSQLDPSIPTDSDFSLDELCSMLEVQQI